MSGEGQGLDADAVVEAHRVKLLSCIDRLSFTSLGKWEEACRERLMDSKETRLLGSMVLRSVRLYREIVRENVRDERLLEKRLRRIEESIKASLDSAAGGRTSG